MVEVPTEPIGRETVIGNGVGLAVGVGVGVGLGDGLGEGDGDGDGVGVGLAVGVGVGPATHVGNLKLATRVFQFEPEVERYSLVNQKVQSSTGSTVRAL